MTSLAPGLLVATPTLRDPNFSGSVVLLVEHSEEGALGFIVNRQGDTRLGSIFEQLDLPVDQVTTHVPVLVGGPVSTQTGWVVFESSERLGEKEDVLRVTDHLAVSASKDALLDAARGVFASRAALVQGYAGWGPGQLDSELAAGIWLPVGLDVSILFDTPCDQRWLASLQRLGIHPASLTHHPVAQA